MNSLRSSRPKPRASTPSLFVLYWLPVILWMGFIFWMSTDTFSSENTSSMLGKILPFLVPEISPQAAELIHEFIRKTAHVTEYFILGLLLFRAFRGDSSASGTCRWPFLAFIVVVLFAVTDELHQSFVPTRGASYVDVGIDTAGGLLAQLVSVLRHCYWKK
jgi:VanZ family protein